MKGRAVTWLHSLTAKYMAVFAILVVGVVGVILDAGFNKLAGFVTYQE